jgi:Metallo-peptidase family M12B Reprolysin-like/PEP-CTERM motif
MPTFDRLVLGASRRARLIVAIGILALMLNHNCAQAAAIPVVLNFDSGGANSFLNNINSAAIAAGAAAFPAADIGNIETAIQNVLTTVYTGFNVSFTTTQNAAQRSVTFGDADGTLFGQAPYNWRNAFLANSTASALTEATSKAQIYPQNFAASLAVGNTVAQNEANLEIAVADTAAHELGHTFGLDHQDSYGDPGITPANYAATGGIQNTHIMATGQTGLSNNRSTARAFSQLEKAKLAQSNNLFVTGGFTPDLITDAGDTHTQKTAAGANAAQPITFQFIPIAGESAVTVTSGSIGAGVHDVYRFTASAGNLLTADIIARTFPAPDGVNPAGTFFNTPASVTVSLFRDNGGAPIQIGATSTNKQYNGNNWLAGASVDADPMILNQPLPANDTYYLDVTSVGTGTGNYEMFVAVPEPATFCLLLLGGGIVLRGIRKR